MLSRVSMVCGVVGVGFGLGGCVVPDSTNPLLRIESAEVSDSGARLELVVENRSAFDLTLREISWEVVYGPTPVGSGVWVVDGAELEAATSGATPLPAGEVGSVFRLERVAGFDFPPLDPTATEIELMGEMRFDGEIEIAPFRISAPVEG